MAKSIDDALRASGRSTGGRPVKGGSQELTRRSTKSPIEGGSDTLSELLATLERVNTIDLEQLAAEAEAKKTELEKMTEQLRKGVVVHRRLPKWQKHSRSCDGKCGGVNKCRRLQSKASRKKYLREYNLKVRAPRRARERGELLAKGGWFALIRSVWIKHKVPFKVTKEEWEREVGTLEDWVPVVHRLDPKKPITLENVVVRDRDSRRLLFDGGEYTLKRLGHILKE